MTSRYRILPIMRPSLKTRVQRRLSELQISPAEATRRGGLGRTTIYDILDGSVKNVRTDTARKLAKALDCDVSYITGEAVEPLKSSNNGDGSLTSELAYARYAGDVAAGVWHESAIFGPDPDLPPDFDAHPPVPIVPDPRYKGLGQFAVKVIGPSVNKIVPDGYFAVCVPYWEARQTVVDGDLVVVERIRGGLHESTIKRVRKNSKGWELMPESDDPKYQSPIYLDEDMEHERDSPDVTIEIKGLVIWKGAPVG